MLSSRQADVNSDSERHWLLGNVLGVGLERLILDPNDTRVSTIDVGGVTVTREQLARMLHGHPVITRDTKREWSDVATTLMGVALRGQMRHLRQLARRYGLRTTEPTLTEIEANAHGTAERAVAKRLGVTPTEVAAAGLALWNQRLLDEREQRRSRSTPPRPRAEVTADLVDELTRRIKTAE